MVYTLSAAIEVGPQPNGVVRADIFNLVKKSLDLTIEWIQEFNSGKKQTLTSKGRRPMSSSSDHLCTPLIIFPLQ